ncbi:hypothetical protein [Streptococcus gallolyticus]|jgi:hypothetical protein|uniref:hypothetical protein n=1 Tax=Streptococcus gallolyticus TaxID=315405 RepID=UPI002284B1BB|nr:hypothetical protein [Streptococcus gallolyticus]MCY7166061.1 hypothetical protein [Streptococcus gallolyticus subsp. gallolyticus]MCY7183159.1 hypothetical protein [Streptococcus gallolyticus subsp. gallolyticus]
MKRVEIEQQLEETYVARRKTAELQETYEYYSGIAAQAEEFFWQDGYQSHYAPRFEMALELTSRYRYHLFWEAEEEIADLRKKEYELEDALTDLLRKEAQDEH